VSSIHGTFAAAAVLTPLATSVNLQMDAAANLTYNGQATSTYFRVHAPTAASGQVVHLIASVYDLATVQDVKITVYDAVQNQLNARNLGGGTGNAVVEVDSVAPDADYFICVNTTTSFKFTVDFTTKDVPFELGSTGGPATATAQTSTLNVAQSQVMYLALSAAGDSGAAIALTIQDAAGNVVCILTSYGGSTRSASVFLAAGKYKVSMTLIVDILNPTATLTYNLAAASITDPIGATVSDPTLYPQGGNGGTIPPPAANGALLYWVADVPNGSLWF
jgi:hypothetical protein